jgi:hypothetical protein
MPTLLMFCQQTEETVDWLFGLPGSRRKGYSHWQRSGRKKLPPIDLDPEHANGRQGNFGINEKQ